jgi:hypothetical protein
MDVIAWTGFFLGQDQFTGIREHSDEHFGSVNCRLLKACQETLSYVIINNTKVHDLKANMNKKDWTDTCCQFKSCLCLH